MGAGRVTDRDIATLCIRIAIGAIFAIAGWGKVSHPEEIVSMWQKLILPAPTVLAPMQGIAELFGGALLILGVLTRLWGLLIALDMAAALVLVRIPAAKLTDPGTWGLEWLAFWVALALFVGGAGSLSLDGAVGALKMRRYGPKD